MERISFIPKNSDLFTKQIEKRTLKAWQPWDHAREMNLVLQQSDFDEVHWEWEIHWTYGVVMLRSVGHVLHKVDTRASIPHKVVIEKTWQSWKAKRIKNWIFWDFIEQERNNILKTFELGVELDGDGIWHGKLETDGIQLLREATYWWRHELEKLEEILT